MTTEAKQINHWKSLENRHTGEPEGLLCHECAKGYPFKFGIHEISCSESNWFAECSCCKKSIQDDYVRCSDCQQIYPKGHDYRVEEGKECLPCHHAL